MSSTKSMTLGCAALFLGFGATALVGIDGTAQAQASRCTPPRVLVVLDKSSSMNNTIGGQKMWSIAKQSLDQIATDYQSKVELGLMVFPNPGQCSPGSLLVPPALNSRTSIMSALGTDDPPASGSYTPMAQSLDVAGGLIEMADTTKPRHIILITDGWQWCSPYDASTRFMPVDSVTRNAAKGITTYVVGFGGSTDALALNRMAVAGGTALPGCDPTGATPTAGNKCYYQADSPGQLLAALNSIGTTVSAEVCDGNDNDCDGMVDEGLTRACSSACGAGAETCNLGTWGGCTAPAPAAEVCDGRDNDCDGTTDPGCQCQVGTSRACGGASGLGECHAGTQRCGGDGRWMDCIGSAGPADEICDGLDNDCDGSSDESDQSPGVCMPGYQCKGAAGCELVPVNMEVPQPEEPGDLYGTPGAPAGCGCDAGANHDRSSGLAAAAGLGLAALVLARMLRRRRR